MICISKSTTCLARIAACRVSVAVLAGLVLPAAALAAPGSCSATPTAAVAAFLRSSEDHGPAEKAAGVGTSSGHGFRVHHVQEDAGLRRQWIWLQDCDAPQRPLLITSAPAEPKTSLAVQPAFARSHSAGSNPVPLEVRSGDDVVVLEGEQDMTLQVSGKATESGHRGDRVHVRLATLNHGSIVTATVTGTDRVALAF